MGSCACHTVTMTNLNGRIGGKQWGFDLHATWRGQELIGRIGAPSPGNGKDIHFTLVENVIEGHVGSKGMGFDLRGTCSPSAIQIRLGGVSAGVDLNLTLHRGVVKGRYGGKAMGKDVHLMLQGSTLTGRIGAAAPGDGKDVALSVVDVPLEVATVVVLCGFFMLSQLSNSGFPQAFRGG